MTDPKHIFNIYGVKNINFSVRDQYNTDNSQAGAIGPNAKIHDSVFLSVWNNLGLDIKDYIAELVVLGAKLKRKADSENIKKGLESVKLAEKTIRNGDGPKSLSILADLNEEIIEFARLEHLNLLLKVITRTNSSFGYDSFPIND